MNTGTPVDKESPTIGVLIINYNYARYLAHTIESVLNQTSPFDEFCVVDDGSTDNSLQVIEPYTSRLKLIAKANGGPMTATLTGVKAMSTDYVYVLDADDFLFPEFVERFRPHLLSRPSKLQCQLVGVDSEGTPNDSVFPSYPREYGAKSMIEDNENIGFYICPPTAANIYQREYLQRLDLASLDPLECFDGVVAMVAPYFGEVVTIAEPLAYYRIHSNNRSAAGRASLQTLNKELGRFERRWRDGCRLLGRKNPPFQKEPLYVLERRLMIAGLDGKSPGSSMVRAFRRRIAKTHFPRQHKAILSIWATLFLLPSTALRHYLVDSRRSAKGRPRILKRLLQFLRPKLKTASP